MDNIIYIHASAHDDRHTSSNGSLVPTLAPPPPEGEEPTSYEVAHASAPAHDIASCTTRAICAWQRDFHGEVARSMSIGLLLHARRTKNTSITDLQRPHESDS